MIDLQAIGITNWMVDTFIYTGLLIALVLLVRRPVTQYFGPCFAYALWALPLVRLIMPPIVLPAWMAPAEPVAAESVATGGQPMMVFIPDSSTGLNETAAVAAAPTIGITVGDLLFPLWLAGAAVFLLWRVREYLLMRRDLLAEARPVGEAGKVRLVETSAVSAPVAFGVRDKVVALPVNFMALLDLQARDMAIAHELEHHRGHDLLANIAAQPLLAMHWFNPLAWWGWRAMRRDQEAACDARVVAGRARSERAVYAEVIAGFAAGEHFGLAAPMASGMASGMACPVLGEKSIIHRLRSLTLTDISTRRRRIGIAAITTTALALPLTASISYAQPPVEPSVQQQAENAEASEIETVDPDVNVRVIRVEHSFEGDAGEVDIDVEELEDGRHIIISTVTDEDGERRVIRRVIRHGEGEEGHAIQTEEIEAIMAEVERELGDLDGRIESQIELALAGHENGEGMGSFLFIQDGEEGGNHFEARCDGDESVSQWETSDGRRAIVLCQTEFRSSARAGLEAALETIRNNQDIPAEARANAVRELEEAIEEMETTMGEALSVMEQAQAISGQVSMRFTPPTPPKSPQARVRTGSVTFGYSASGTTSQTMRVIPMVHPLTGHSVAVPHAQDDCDEA